jgi:hypothetical protein
MRTRRLIRKVALAASVCVLLLLLASCEQGVCRYSSTGMISIKNGLLLIYETGPGLQLSWKIDSAGQLQTYMGPPGFMPASPAIWAPPTRIYAPRWALVSYNQPAMVTMGSASDHEWIINLFWPSGVITAGLMWSVLGGRRVRAGHCARCQYDLCGSASATVCPECGTAITPSSN